MGLFVTEDGHFQGWLAAFLCCCAAVSDDESPIEKERSRRRFHCIPKRYECYDADYVEASTRVGVCNEQPLQLSTLPTVPPSQARPVFKSDERTDVFDSKARPKPNVADRPPSLKPLDLGESSLMGRWPYHRQKPSLGHGSRPSIGVPYGFRRLENTDAQSQSLVPLRLGPVVLRESPAPDTDIPTPDKATKSTARKRSDSTQELLSETSKPESYHSNRETPFQRCQQRNSNVWPFPPEPVVLQPQQLDCFPEEKRHTRPPMTPRSRSSSSSRRQGGDVSSITSRPSSERLHPRRKRSLQSIRDDQEVEKEIVELNTIIEERRAESTRENGSNQHIAAVAPSMPIRARSETLDAIGSALSRPLTARDLYRPTTPVESTSDKPLPPPTSTTTRLSTRVSGWLSGMFPSSSSGDLPDSEPFYKCQPPPRPLGRSYSESSIITSLTDIDSPSLTAASSPTSKGHSRSHTGESRITPMTPSAMYGAYGVLDDRKVTDDHWPIAMTPSAQVGVAL